jgi:ABC-2 type transport system permease protein
MLGEPLPLLALLAGSAALFALAALALGRRFSDAAAATQGKTAARPAKATRARPGAPSPPARSWPPCARSCC